MVFADLMSSGTLTCQSQLRIPSSNQDFLSIINKIFVEKINSAVSLYAETILGQLIALLFKSINSQNDILIDDKSTETHYLSNLMKEIKTSL
ncbi:unnamed protein product [Rotaria sordida]|uniref:AP-3 complex subunit delta Mu C-terminal domain-containing protein n=1 Tax=Rotaria sordida TaxID=392033 RepID=A0A820B002_9BILA|nr:unnamed protein product [Rotaria sordida]CAF1503127.1 unnamed protein product [Rotaria sordida]CAF3945375.1 unnamed protein product [Rotaria sordida]CAF4191303.1 unnamed protein product [Rotaria sordida]